MSLLYYRSFSCRARVGVTVVYAIMVWLRLRFAWRPNKVPSSEGVA
jgi:hypothetical protein